MRTTIRDREVLNSLRPTDVIGYLRSVGWVREVEIGDKASVWVKPDDPAGEVLVPLLRNASDFAVRMADVLGKLESTEQRSQEEIVKDLLTTSADLVRVRSLATEAGDGTIPLQAGVTLVEQAREMVLAAACATVTPRSYWARRKPNRAVEFVQGVRMGQTESGSYVLTMHSPVSPALRTEAPTDSPFERRVMQTLMRSLVSVREAAQQAAAAGDLQPFREAVHSGVSANLCDALVGLGEISPNRGLEVSVAWSRSRPLEGHPQSRATIASDFLPIIEEASRLFKETEPQDDFELFGFVERLYRPVGQEAGQVTVHALIEERPRRVMLELRDPRYEDAVRAHRDRLAISCTGDLSKEGRSFWLTDLRDFRVLDIEEETE
jgi:hypothetical protein